MRSPTDYDGGSRLVYHSSFFDDDDLSTESMKDNNRKVLNIITRCLRFLCCKKSKVHSPDDTSLQNPPFSVYTEPKRKFSFTEAEILQMSPLINRSVSIQTGDSLEMAHFTEIAKYNIWKASLKNNKQLDEVLLDSDKKLITIQQSEKELSALRRTRGMSANLQSSSKNFSVKKLEKNDKECSEPAEQEIELRNTLYDRERKRHVFSRHISARIRHDINPEPLEQKRTKRLRFEERATTIEPSAAHQNDDENDSHRQRKRFTNTDLNTIEENEEAASSTGKDFRRFWGKGKKKKTQSLR